MPNFAQIITMRPLFVSLFLSAVCLTSCDEQPDKTMRTDGYSQVPANREDSLFQDVMKGHDIGMARMGKLSGTMDMIQDKLDSLERLPEESAANDALQRTWSALLDELRLADEGMQSWMTEFRADSAQDDPSRRIEYLEKEKLRVEKVKDDILNSLQKADSLLKN